MSSQNNLQRIAVVLVLVAIGSAGAARAQQAIRIGTSSVGSNFYRVAVGAGEVVNEFARLNTTVEAVGGSAANVRGLGREDVEFAVANAFAAVTGYQGSFSFKQRIDIRLAVQGSPSYRAIVWRKRARVKGPEDLIGRTYVGRRRALPELALITDAMFKVFGIDASRVKVIETTNTGEVLKALAVGSIDGAILPMGRGAANIQKPMKEGVLEFYHLPKAKRDRMLEQLPGLIFAETFAPGDFEGLDRPVEVFAMNTYFITRPGVSDDVAYRVVKAIFEHTEAFANYHREGRSWTLENTLRNFQIPFHPGVIRYFKEQGVWTAERAARQEKLMR